MFEKVLIANRGEIAVWILHACTELGLGVVAICSQVDRNALHVQLADGSVCMGPAPSAKSYLNMNAILSACKIAEADVVHPGVGFLNENAEFAERREEQRICFIGLEAEVVRRTGNKANAKRTAAAAGVPTIPGSPGVTQGQKETEVCARHMGFPVLIKAYAGSGGRGVRRMDYVSQLPEVLAVTREEALRFFGCGDVYLERKLLSPHHAEVQILADLFGNVVCLGECDCSLRRRRQEILEECPSPNTTLMDEIHRKMEEVAVHVTRQVSYTGVGTVEFLLNHDGSFYFMEMNTRTQVEHSITELVWGVDLVERQIRVARGERLAFRQSDLLAKGHAIECRINAGTPEKNFTPSVDALTNLRLLDSGRIRLGTAAYEGYSIPPYCNNLLIKLITHAPTREQATAKVRQTIREFSVPGVDTNAAFQMRLLQNEAFQSTQYDICTLESEKNIAALV